MKDIISYYTNDKLKVFENTYFESILSTSLSFDNYKIVNKSISLETKIILDIDKTIPKQVTSSKLKCENNITSLIDFLDEETITMFELLYNNNLNIEKIAYDLKRDVTYIRNSIDNIAYLWNYLLPNSFFDNIWQLMEKNEILLEKDLELGESITQKVIYVLLSSKSFKEFYFYDDKLNTFILYKYKDFYFISNILKDYLIRKEKNYFTLSELLKSIPYENKDIKLQIVEKLVDNKILEIDDNKYTYLQLKYMYEDKIISALAMLKEDQLNVLIYRFVKHLTLEEVGQKISKTRERIRQIEEASLKKLYTLLPKELLNEIRSYVSKNNILLVEKIQIRNSEHKALIIAIICYKKLKFNYHFSEELNAVVISNEFKYHAIITKLLNKIKDSKQMLLTNEELIKQIKNILPNFKSSVLINALLDNNDLSRVEDKYFFHTLYKTKRMMVELIFELEENGFETMKESSRIKEILDKFFPDSFSDSDTGRNIATYAQTNEKIILWDWGKYIHIKHIQYILDEFDFTDIIEYLNNNLESTTQIDLNGYFEEHRDSLVDFGIVSKYALHSLLKIKFPNDFSYQDSPWVSIEGTTREGLGDTLLSTMSENKIYTLDELSNKLQTQPSRIQQLIERQRNIIIVDTFQYLKLIDLNFPKNILEKIIEYLNNIIEDLTFIYIELIVDRFRLELNCINKYNKESVLLDLLKKTTSNKKFNVNNTRIVDINYPITRNSLNFQYIIENKLLKDRQQIDKNAIFSYFTSRGLSNNSVMHYFLYSKYKTVVRKNDDLFILIDSIGLNNEKIEKLNLIVLEYLEDEQNVDDLIYELQNQLPTISLPWNKYILGDLLDNELFEFYPNRIEPIYIKLKK